MKKRLFRLHRKDIAESMATEVGVCGLKDIEAILRLQVDSPLTNIHIERVRRKDRHMPEGWNKGEYAVRCNCLGYEDVLVGWANFCA